MQDLVNLVSRQPTFGSFELFGRESQGLLPRELDYLTSPRALHTQERLKKGEAVFKLIRNESPGVDLRRVPPTVSTVAIKDEVRPKKQDELVTTPYKLRGRVATPDASGLISISRHVWAEYSLLFDPFREQVSESMFVWYCIHLYWQRVMHLMKLNGNETAESRKYLAHSQQILGIPGIIYKYLEDLGNFFTHGGHLLYLSTLIPSDTEIIMHSDLTGFFGRVNDETCVLYQRFPSPGIAAMSICKDMQFSTINTSEREHWWNLPLELRPLSLRAGLPTVNLLGYSPAKKLSNKQVDILLRTGVRTNGLTFGTRSKSAFCFNSQLFNMISTIIKQLPIVGISRQLPRQSTGSDRQGLFQMVFSAHCDPSKHFTDAFVTTQVPYWSKGNDETSVQDIVMCYRPFRQSISKFDGPVDLKTEVIIENERTVRADSLWESSYKDKLKGGVAEYRRANLHQFNQELVQDFTGFHTMYKVWSCYSHKAFTQLPSYEWQQHSEENHRDQNTDILIDHHTRRGGNRRLLIQRYIRETTIIIED